MKFFVDSRAANLRAAFEDEGLEARLREIESSDESVVSATDDDDVACLRHGLGRPLHVFQNFESCQTPVCAHDAAARMSCRSAHVKVLNWRAILRPAGNRTQKE